MTTPHWQIKATTLHLAQRMERKLWERCNHVLAMWSNAGAPDCGHMMDALLNAATMWSKAKDCVNRAVSMPW